MYSSISVGVHRFLCAGHRLCFHVIDPNGSLCVRINGGHPPRSKASQPFQLSRGRRASSRVRIAVYESVHMQTLSVTIDNRCSHTSVLRHRLTDVCPAKYKAHMLAYHTQEMAFEGTTAPPDTLSCAHPSNKTAVSHFLVSPHVEQVGNSGTNVTHTHAHMHAHTHTPVPNDRHNKRPCQLAQQLLSTT